MTTPDSPAADGPGADPFPYAYSPEVDLPRYLRVRAEGIPLRQALWSGLSYLRKNLQPKRSAPPEEVSYFNDQRRLLRCLAHGPKEPLPGCQARLAMVGDLMWLRDGWHDFLSPEVLAYLNGHEVVLGNLETPITARFKVPWLLPDYFSYNSDPALITSFRRPSGGSTFSALATCNNHSLDRGDTGLSDTLDFLDRQAIHHAGVRRKSDEKSYAVFECAGIRLGFYAACWGLNNPAAIHSSSLHIEVLPGLVPQVCHPVDFGRIRKALAGMEADGVEFKVVYLHWGYEFELYPCPELMRVGREIIAAGADVLMGSHPHVVQPLEVCFVNGYEKRHREQGADLPAMAQRTGCLLRDAKGLPRKGLIVYSLGNFATTMYTPLCRTGMILSLHLGRDEAGRVDWHRPEVQFVCNIHRDPDTRRRRLVLVESFLRERERHRDHAHKVRAAAAFLRRHLFGEPD
jgi:poly-gamma-glutamate synthesis protein (capsule biosynthesis protein)